MVGRWLGGIAFITLVSFVPRVARAADPAPIAAVDDPSAETPEAKKKRAQARFEQGVKLFEANALDAALAEFLASRKLFPTRAATTNAAACLAKLHRFDEAADMYEALLREFPNLPAEDKDKAQKELAELRKLTGSIDVRDSEPGAPIVVDGRERGSFPAMSPLRVAAGSHVVRIYKEGFQPFETRIEVAGGQIVPVSAKLKALVESGRVKVAEQTGKALDVVVDSVVVGKTPWEGPLAVGDHTVFLRGEGNLGSQPVSIPVKKNETAALSIHAEPLEAALRVEPTPGGARVAIDGVVVARGLWEGKLKVGPHLLEVGAEGFLAQRRNLNLARGSDEKVTIALERDLDSPLWRLAVQPKVTFELDAEALIAPSLGGQVLSSCADGCERGLGFGAALRGHATYQLRSGIALGGFVGYFGVGQDGKGKATALTPVGLPADIGKADDSIGFKAFLVGLSGSYRRGEKFPLLARLGVGLLVGSTNDERSGDYTHSGVGYGVPSMKESSSATYVTVAPELRAGMRLGEHFEASVGLTGYVLFATSQPKWRDASLTTTPGGFATYGEQTTMGKIVFAIAPGLGARYDF